MKFPLNFRHKHNRNSILNIKRVSVKSYKNMVVLKDKF